MPTGPSALVMVVLGLLLALIPGFWLRGENPAVGRTGRVVAALVIGTALGAWLGSQTLSTELSPPLGVGGFLLTTVLFTEGLAGRGWPWAGAIASLAYFALLLRDALDRTGEKGSPVVWIVFAVVSLVFAWGAQGGWRVVWNRIRTRPAPEAEPPGT